MVDVDNLSDDQLRSRLLEFGFPVMPITGTTRKVLVKKLKLFLENKNKINKKSNDRISLGLFSSEDESDIDIKTTKKIDKSRRVTMGGTLPTTSTMQPPNKVVLRKNEKKDIKNASINVRTTKTIEKSTSHDDFDTGSESDEIAESYSIHQQKQYRDSSINYNNNRNTSIPSASTSAFSTSTNNYRLPSSFIAGANAADAAAERLQQIRSRLSLNSPITSPSTSFINKRHQYEDENAYKYTNNDDDIVEQRKSTPFLSNFTRRLSQNRNDNSKSGTLYEYKSDIKENDINGSNARNYLNRSKGGRFVDEKSVNSKTNQWRNLLKQNNMSIMVLLVAFIFFMFIILLYVGISSDTSTSTKESILFEENSGKQMNPYNKKN